MLHKHTNRKSWCTMISIVLDSVSCKKTITFLPEFCIGIIIYFSLKAARGGIYFGSCNISLPQMKCKFFRLLIGKNISGLLNFAMTKLRIYAIYAREKEKKEMMRMNGWAFGVLMFVFMFTYL